MDGGCSSTNMTVSVEDYNITEDAKEGLDGQRGHQPQAMALLQHRSSQVEQPSTDTGKQTVTVEKRQDASTGTTPPRPTP